MGLCSFSIKDRSFLKIIKMDRWVVGISYGVYCVRVMSYSFYQLENQLNYRLKIGTPGVIGFDLLYPCWICYVIFYVRTFSTCKKNILRGCQTVQKLFQNHITFFFMKPFYFKTRFIWVISLYCAIVAAILNLCTPLDREKESFS